MKFDIDKVRKEVYKEASFYGNLPNQTSILGLELHKVKIHMRNGEVLKGIVKKIGKYEILLKEEGERDVVIYKHAIDKIEPV